MFADPLFKSLSTVFMPQMKNPVCVTLSEVRFNLDYLSGKYVEFGMHTLHV